MAQSTRTPQETVTLEDDDSRACVVVAPARGGMVTRFEVAGSPVLFLDEATLIDPSKNVRGGNPVLFPSPGPLAGERFARDGQTGSMKQHGFARQLPWSVLPGASKREVTLELAADDVTRAQFPWDFLAWLRYALAGKTLTVETRIENCGTAPLPFALGFHPYFAVPDASKSRARISTDATRAFDNVTKANVELRGPIDLTQKEVDLHLIDHTLHSSTLERGDGTSVVVAGDAGFRRWVVWTQAGKDFVCLEPWTAPADALNTGEGLMSIAPGEHVVLTMTMTLVP